MAHVQACTDCLHGRHCILTFFFDYAGATGYIAILALAGETADQIKPLTLLLNMLLASMGYCVIRAGHLPWSGFYWVYVLAVPATFLGDWLILKGE